MTGSAKLFVTRSIEYSHHELHFSVDKEYVFIHDDEADTSTMATGTSTTSPK